MLKLGKTQRAIAMTAATLALAGASTATANSANATERAATCTTIDIGDPGQMWIGGTYVGEVEQQYDECSYTVIAHWQWSGTWQQYHSGTARVAVYLQATNYYQGPVNDQPDTVKDVPAYVGVHATSPDQWAAHAVVNYGQGVLYCGTYGTVHDYSNGGTVQGAHPTWC